MKKQSTLFFLFFSISLFIYSQDIDYSSFSIPKKLTENANAVVRNAFIEITIEDIDEMTVYKRKVVTVLNKLGNVDARISERYDNDTKIKDLSAIIYDASGEEIKKYKERDFSDASAVDGGTLYSDSRVKYIDYTPISYPYTVVFESEYKTSSTGFIPPWFPINGYYISVEKSKYKLINPLNLKIRKKEKSFKNYLITDNSTEFNVEYVLRDQKAIKYEDNTVAAIDFMPHLLVGTNSFALKSVVGKAENWSEFGKWRYEYLKNGNDELSEGIKSKINQLVKGIENPIEKAKIVYQFVQDKTRYISVQEGIGGWKPIPANEVDKVGYGDCKGLTNYTKALLDAVGVKSHYSVIWAGPEKRNVEKDFFGMQGNHVILNIPNNGNDVWLECTSQTMPFGFLGDFTDDRNVLVVTPEGGVIKRTTVYKDDKNFQKTAGEIILQKDGSLKASLQRISEGLQYDDKSGYVGFTEEELYKNYKSEDWSYNNNLEIESAELTNNKNDIIFTEDIKASIKNYATVNNTEYLFRVNVFNRNTYVPKRYRKRKLPLRIYRGYKDEDIFKVTIPKDYILGNLPPEKSINSKFGTYKVSITKINDTSFMYNRVLSIKEGVYPKEDYRAYRSFRRSIAKYEGLRIAITKKP